MKRNLIAMTAASAIALGGLSLAVAEHGGARDHARGRHGRGFGLERITRSLDLTPDQRAKVDPIIQQTRPQIAAIHQEAMQKTHTVLENAMSQIRPLLTPEQQKKLDDVKKAHEDMRKAHEELHAAMKQ